MTIAVCYVCSEGVVLGADSTTSAVGLSGQAFHYFNHNQKVFEIGEGSSLGIATWGLASLGMLSYRTLVAELADKLKRKSATSVLDAANQWVDQFWQHYEPFVAGLKDFQALKAKSAHDPSTPNQNDNRTAEEEADYQQMLLALQVGFCVGGYCLPDRAPKAFQIIFEPLSGKPTPVEIPCGNFWAFGAPNMMIRLIWGYDQSLPAAIMQSGKWQGTQAELDEILNQNFLSHGNLPIRDAIDFVHTCILSTVKALKFSNFNQICGGPIEIGVITTDRRFRWVRHKPWDAAIDEGVPS